MTQFDHLIARLEQLIDRVETVLPAAPPQPDWSASAFRWRQPASGAGYLQAVKNPHRVALASLQNVDRQKEAILRNTAQFVAGHEANNVLLTGARGTGKSTLIKALCGAVTPDGGEIRLAGEPVSFRSPLEARLAGIETVYQDLALSPALSIADNMFLGRELRKSGVMGTLFRTLDRSRMQKIAREKLADLGLMTIQNINQAVETLSGGQRQGVAVARAAAFGSRVVIMDEPTAALGVKESRRVLELMLDVKRRGLPIVLISHNMPHVFEVADRIHIHRLGRRIAVIDPKQFSMSDAVAIMTGAMKPPAT